MEFSHLIVSLLVVFNGMLVGLVAFFLKQLLYKFSRVEESINKLNNQISIIVTKQDHHKDQFHHIDVSLERFDVELKSIRDRMHGYGNALNGMQAKCEMYVHD